MNRVTRKAKQKKTSTNCSTLLFVPRSPGLGGDSEDGDTKEKDEEAERERLEAIKEAEDRRKEKHRKMEEEREKMRQDIRDKVRSLEARSIDPGQQFTFSF